MKTETEPFWWQSDEDATADAVWAYVTALDEAQKEVHERHVRHAKLYGNCDMLGLDTSLGQRDYKRRPAGRITENIIESVCDTATSMIAKNRPRPKFLTDDAEWSVQRRAKQLERYIEAVFQSSNIYQEAVKVFRDAVVFGTGAMKTYVGQDGKIVCERVIIDEIKVDERECRSCGPRQLHQVKQVDREALKREYPDHEEAIDRANIQDGKRWYTSWQKLEPTQIVVIESWHLPSGPGADDGLHTVVIDGETLEREEMKEDDFPFVFYHWSSPLLGFYGKGLAETLTGHQLRLNQIQKTIERAQSLIAVPRIFMPLMSKVSPAQITNEVGALIPYRGPKPPTFLTPPAMPPEMYQEREWIKRSAFELAGISQLSASSKKPAGLESAVALREFSDIETQRFSIQSQAYEEMFMQLAEKVVRLAKETHGGKHEVVWRSHNLIKKIKWADVDMDSDRFQITVEAASILSRTPAGRLQNVIEMSQAGLIEMDEARRLMGHPDLERSMSLANAAIDDIEAAIEEHLDGEGRPPEAYQNLELGLKRFTLAYLKARRDGAPEEILDGFRQWIARAEDVLGVAEEAAQPPAMGPGAPAGMPPEGMPPEGMPPGGMPPEMAAAMPAGMPV